MGVSASFLRHQRPQSHGVDNRVERGLEAGQDVGRQQGCEAAQRRGVGTSVHVLHRSARSEQVSKLQITQ